MAKVRVVAQPSGLINGLLWPEAGEEMELADAVAESMAEAGHVELVEGRKVEKRPAASSKTESR